MLNGIAPNVGFDVGGHHYPMFYLLIDGMYLEYTIFMKTINIQIHREPNRSGSPSDRKEHARMLRGALAF